MTPIAYNRSSTRDTGALLARSTGLIGALIVVAHVALALWWGTVVPIGEGPDEPGHFNYVLFVAQQGRLPIQQADPASSDVPGEGHQPPLAYWLMQPAVRWLPPGEQTLELGANPEFTLSGGNEPNAFLRSTRDLWPYSGIGLAWHLARAFSALLGGATVALTWATARRLRPDQPWIAAGAAALLAFNPQVIFSHALVSNDPLLFTLASALILICVVLVTGDQRDRRWIVGLGVMLGALLITKQSALALVPLPFLALLLRRRNLRSLVIDGAIVVALALAISGWWYVRNLRLYGDWLGLGAFQETFASSGGSALTARELIGGMRNLLRTSWGAFGWLTITLNNGAYQAFGVWTALGVIGLLASIGRGWWHRRGAAAIVLASATVLIFVWTIAFARVAGPVAWQGRFLFPASSALAIGLAIGLGAVLPGRSALWSLIGLLALLAIALPGGRIAPAYERFVLPPQPESSGNTYARMALPWKRGVELRSIAFPASARSGDTLTIDMRWHVLEQLDTSYLVFVHVVDQQGEIVAESNQPPKAGRFPTSSWVRGDWIDDTQQVSLRGVAPGRYEIFVGLWDQASGRTLDSVDRDGQRHNWRFDAGSLEIR